MLINKKDDLKLMIKKMKKVRLNKEQKKIRKRILEILYNKHSSHIGSCISVVDLIGSVYSIKNKEEKFVLSCGHSAVALYVVLEKYGLLKNSSINNLSFHPDRDVNIGIDVSTGSLGQGLPIAVGMALANRNKKVYCLVSDGECAEGSIWESLRIIYDQKLYNLKLIVSANGWGAFGPISTKSLKNRLKGFGFEVIQINGHNPKEILNAIKANLEFKPIIVLANTDSEQFPFLNGQDAHYYIMKENDYNLAIDLLE